MNAVVVSADWVRARCSDDGDCLVWNLKRGRSGQPVYHFVVDGTSTTKNVRPLAWKAAGKRELKPGEVLTMGVCKNPACLNAAHMHPTTRAEVLRRVSQAPSTKRTRYAAVTKANRAKLAKLTIEDARYVRASDKTLAELAQELGVSIQLLSMVRRGERWPDPDASHFVGLGARA